MDLIHLLPDHVANQIAAGEVIQRPSGCLKELVENSLDAGATKIQILVRDAGRTYLQVIDNGKGMSETDARMAFERHATSKIQSAADLFQLHTMGFRGEALASICAVSQVEMLTRQETDELGTRLEIHGSTVISQEPIACPVGTNFKVKNLFYNVPARRKFLKTDATELRNLLSDFYRIALVYPEVQFTFISNDEILMDLPASNLKQRIEGIFGTSTRNPYTSELVEINCESEIVRIYGYVGKPEAATRNSKQYFFVNGRYMRHPYFHKAVMNAYSGMLVGDAAPAYFIYFDINPETIDVNIHPTKTEIKFADEQMIFPILLATIREALGKFNITPPLDFTEGQIEMPSASNHRPLSIDAPVITHEPIYNPFHTSSSNPPGAWQQLYPTAGAQDNTPFRETIPTPSEQLLPIPVTLTENTLTQVIGKYILLPMEDGLMLINQHRAHRHILYHQFLNRLNDHNGQRQQLLFPDIWDVDKSDVVLIDSLLTDLSGLGFDITALTPGSYTINGMPSLLGNISPLPVLQNILDTVRETGLSAKQEWQKKIALTMAKAAAIRYGQKLTQQEMKHLLDELFLLPDHRFTSDGKTITTLLSQEQLDKLFA